MPQNTCLRWLAFLSVAAAIGAGAASAQDGDVKRLGPGTLGSAGHATVVTHLAFSPDGKLLASASRDHTIILWDVVKQREKAVLLGHAKGPTDPSGVNAVAFSPCGNLLASAGSDKTVRIWDVATGKQRVALSGHSSEVHHVAFQGEGKVLASASGGQDRKAKKAWGEIKLWDAATGREIGSLEGHAGTVTYLAYSPDGKTLASASADKTIILWDARTHAQQAVLRWHTERVHALAFSRDGKKLASLAGDRTIRLWDVKSASEVAVFKHIGSQCVAFSGDGKRLLTGVAGTVVFLNAETGKEEMRVKNHTVAVSTLALGADGEKLASGGWDGTIRVCDAKTGAPLAPGEGHAGQVLSLAFSRDGRFLASASDDETIKVWSLATGRELKTLKTGPVGRGLILSPDGKTLASGHRDHSIRLWDIETGMAKGLAKAHTLSVECLAFSPDGKLLASGSWDKTVRLWDLMTGAELIKPLIHDGPVRAVSFSPNGKRLASSTHSRAITFWDVETGEGKALVKGGVAFSICPVPALGPHDLFVSTRPLKIWDGARGTQLGALDHRDAILAAFSADHKTLATADFFQTVKIWEVATRKELASVKAPERIALLGALGRDRISCIVFSPDARTLAIGCDASILLWTVSPTRSGEIVGNP